MARVIAGVDKRDHFHGGEILLDGRPVRYRVPRRGVKDGIMYITEGRKLDGFFETMSIASNIHLGSLAAERRSRWWVRNDEASRAANEWVKSLNIKAISGDSRVIELSGGNQQKVVIAKSLIQNPKVMIFEMRGWRLS